MLRKGETTKMIDLSKIIINIKKKLLCKKEININKVLLLQTQGEKEIYPQLLNEKNWKDTLRKLKINPKDPLFYSVEAFFSSGTTHRQHSCLIGSIKSNTCPLKFLKSIEEKEEILNFRALVLIEDWQSIPLAKEILSFCSHKKIFVLSNTKEILNLNENYLILVHHNQNEKTNDNGYLLEKYTSQLFKKFEENPTAIAQIPLREAVGLKNSLLSDDLKLKFQTNFINQYYKSEGALEVSLGTTMSGESIEEINFNTRFLEKDITSKVKEWRIDTHPSLYSRALFRSKLLFLMEKYKAKGYLTLSPFNNPSDLRFYNIDDVLLKEEEKSLILEAKIRYSYNYKVRELLISIE